MRESKILAAGMLGKEKGLFRVAGLGMSARAKEISPDYMFDEGIFANAMGKVLSSDQALTILASNDDPVLLSLLQYIFDEANANPDQK